MRQQPYSSESAAANQEQPMTFRTTALTVFAAKTPANNFILVNQTGKTIGNAAYTIETAKDGGYKVKTRFEYHLSAAANAGTQDEGAQPDVSGRAGGNGAALIEVQNTGEYKVDANGNFLSGFTQNVANQMMTSFTPNKKRDSVAINHMQGGVAGSPSDLPVPSPQFLVAPDFDPSVIQVLLTTAIQHPHPDSMYLLVVPGTSGRSGDNAVPIAIQLAPDSPTGTLDGKPVALKHYLLNYHTGHADLYTAADGNLMEAIMNPLDASYVRAKFELAKQ
jgi:hypothetical protein